MICLTKSRTCTQLVSTRFLDSVRAKTPKTVRVRFPKPSRADSACPIEIIALETSLATASRTRVELRDPQKNYNKMTQKDLQAVMPDWNWADYFKSINLVEPGDINVHQPEFFKAANAAFTKTSIDDWKTYLRWHLIDATAAELSNDFVNEDFNFKEGVLRGTKQIKPRWKRVVLSTDGAIGRSEERR